MGGRFFQSIQAAFQLEDGLLEICNNCRSGVGGRNLACRLCIGSQVKASYPNHTVCTTENSPAYHCEGFDFLPPGERFWREVHFGHQAQKNLCLCSATRKMEMKHLFTYCHSSVVQ